MAIDFLNQAPAILIINNYPLVFGEGLELKDCTEMLIGKAEDKKAYNWSSFYTDPTGKSQIAKDGTNYNLDGIKGINSVFVRPVFSGLEININITLQRYGLLYPILKPLIEFVYRQGANTKQFTSFYSPLYYIIDGYMESSTIKQNSTESKIEWHLVIKSKQTLLDTIDKPIQTPKNNIQNAPLKKIKKENITG